VTDAVLEDIAAWRSRPLEAVYPIVYFDALHVKMTEDRSVRTRACYLAGHLRRRPRSAGNLVAGRRGREVLARRPQRPRPARGPGRPDRMRRQPRSRGRGPARALGRRDRRGRSSRPSRSTTRRRDRSSPGPRRWRSR
jgi:hypothetical protein